MERQAQLKAEAWIGDAVLAIYARMRILDETGAIDNERATRMTSNRFLSVFGEPTSVEAGIGRLYKEKGLDAAFAYIEAVLMPVFEKQELNRLGGQKPPRGR
jgi:23S rRNA maturation mini-RNase III